MSLLSGYEHIVRENEPLAPFTRFKIGVPAEYFAEPTNEDELIGLVKQFSEAGQPIRLIGNRSNVSAHESLGAVSSAQAAKKRIAKLK